MNSRTTLACILIGNLIPFFGVLFFNWDLAQIIILYWVENIIIGLWNIPRILLAKKSPLKLRIGGSIQFLIGYAIFCRAHCYFILRILEDYDPSIKTSLEALLQLITSGVIIGAFTIFFSIGWEFFKTHIQSGEYKNWDVDRAVKHPMLHLFVMQISIIIAGTINIALNSPTPLLIVLIIGKTILEHCIKADKK